MAIGAIHKHNELDEPCFTGFKVSPSFVRVGNRDGRGLSETWKGP